MKNTHIYVCPRVYIDIYNRFTLRLTLAECKRLRKGAFSMQLGQSKGLQRKLNASRTSPRPKEGSQSFPSAHCCKHSSSGKRHNNPFYFSLLLSIRGLKSLVFRLLQQGSGAGNFLRATVKTTACLGVRHLLYNSTHTQPDL